MQGFEQRNTINEGRIARSRSRASRNCVANARVTEAEQRELLAAARAEGKALSEWGRDVLLREARKRTDDPLFTEIIATRMLLNSLLQLLASDQKITPDNLPEMLAYVRREKHQAAREVMAQYTASEEGESNADKMGA